MGDNEEIHGAIRDLSEKVGGLTSELSSFRREYNDGRHAAREATSSLAIKMDDFSSSLSRKVEKPQFYELTKEVAFKFDSRKHLGLKRVSWMLENWKTLAMTMLVLAWLGAVTIDDRTINFVRGLLISQ